MHQRREKKMPKEVLAGAVLDLHQAETRLGIVKAVTEAIALDADHRWVLFLPRIKKPGRLGFGRRALSMRPRRRSRAYARPARRGAHAAVPRRERRDPAHLPGGPVNYDAFRKVREAVKSEGFTRQQIGELLDAITKRVADMDEPELEAVAHDLVDACEEFEKGLNAINDRESRRAA
jgi:hypothetical protein